MALQSLRSRLKSLELERGTREDAEGCSSSNLTSTPIDQTQALNEIEQSGNKPEDWLVFLKTMEQQTKDADDSETVKCTFLSNLYSRAMKAVPVELSKDNEAYAQIMINCANLKSTYNVEDARSVFSSARIFARNFAIVHVALAQFELMQGNKDKARRILQKAKVAGAQPTATLSTAYKNLLLGHQDLLSEEESKTQNPVSETSSGSRGQDDKENSTLESPLELLQPKLSWRSSCKDFGTATQSHENILNPNTSTSAKIYTDILKPMPSADNGHRDSLSGVGPPLKKRPLQRIDCQPAATPAVVPRLEDTNPLTALFREGPSVEDSTVSFPRSHQKNIGQVHAVSSSNEADTVPLALASVATHAAHRVPHYDHKEEEASVRTLRSCHSTPDCKNPGMLSRLSLNTSTGRRKDLGRPQRIRPLRCSLPPQLEEKLDVNEHHAHDSLKLKPMPDLDMDASRDITIPCASGAECDSGMDSTSSTGSVFSALTHEQSKKQSARSDLETMDCADARLSSGERHTVAKGSSAENLLSTVQQGATTASQLHPTLQSLPPQMSQQQRGQVHSGGVMPPMMGGPPQAHTPVVDVMHTPAGNRGEMLRVNGKQYMVLKLLGRGGSSKVYEVLDPDNNLRAVKRISLEGASESTVSSYRNEILLLKRLQSSDKIIKLYDFDYSKSQKVLHVVMERGDTDLASFFRTRNKRGSLSQSLRKFYWSEMLEAVKVLHSQGIVHSDLKPANFLLVAGNIKLIDFGIAHALQQDMTSITLDQQVGTINYMSPEAIMDSQGGTSVDEHGNIKPKVKIGVKSDVWSLGCILYNLVYGKTPFQQIAHQLLKLQAIINPGYAIEFPPIEEADLLDTLKKCLIRDPKMRPTIDDLLQHPYLK